MILDTIQPVIGELCLDLKAEPKDEIAIRCSIKLNIYASATSLMLHKKM